MQILGLLGMCFGAVVVEVENNLLLSDWLWPYCESYTKHNKINSSICDIAIVIHCKYDLVT